MFGSYANGGSSIAYANSAIGFFTNVGNSMSGSSDSAYFYGAPSGTDTYYAYADSNGCAVGGHVRQLRQRGRAVTYANSALGFDTNVGNSQNSNDTAYFYDVPGASYSGTATYYAYAESNGAASAGMYGGYGSGSSAVAYANSALGFDTNLGFSNDKANETAYLDGVTSGNNTLYANAAIARLYGTNFDEQASGFGVVTVTGATTNGVNTADTQTGLEYTLNLIGTWVGG